MKGTRCQLRQFVASAVRHQSARRPRRQVRVGPRSPFRSVSCLTVNARRGRDAVRGAEFRSPEAPDTPETQESTMEPGEGGVARAARGPAGPASRSRAQVGAQALAAGLPSRPRQPLPLPRSGWCLAPGRRPSHRTPLHSYTLIMRK